MSRFLYLLTVFSCSLVLGACGGKGAGKIAKATGAELAPADSIAFISLSTERSNPGWQQAIGLAARVPVLQGALDRLTELGVCPSAVQSRLGKTVDVAVLGANGKPGESFVVMTRPKDTAALKRLLPLPCCDLSAAGCGDARSDPVRKGAGTATSRKMPALAVRERDGWLLASDSQATLDRFESEAKRGTLAGSHDFQSAFDSLPKGALVRAYLNGDAVSSLIAGRLEGLFPGLGLEKRLFAWIALSARPFEGGFRLDGSVAGLEARNVPNTLIDEAPADSLLAVSVGGSGFGLAEVVDRSRGDRLAWARALLGLTQNDLKTLARGKIVAYVTKLGLPDGKAVVIDPRSGRIVSRPELALELRVPGAGAFAGRIEKKLPALAISLAGRARHISVAGGRAEELTVGTLRLLFGATKGRMFLSTDEAIIARGPRLTSLAAFARAEKALVLAKENAGVLYLDLSRVGVGQSSARTRSQTVFLTYLDASGGRLRIRGVLMVR